MSISFPVGGCQRKIIEATEVGHVTVNLIK